MRHTIDIIQTSEIQTIDKQHKRALASLLEKAVAAVGIGAACHVIPALLEPSPTAIAIAAGLRMGGWIAIGVGVVLFCVRLSVQSKTRKRASLPRRDQISRGSRDDRNDTHRDQPQFPLFDIDAPATSPGFALRHSASSTTDAKAKAQ